MCYTLTRHAWERIRERGLTESEIAAALAGRTFDQADGCVAYRGGRCVLIVNPESGRVVTAMRVTRNQLKRSYSR